MRWKKMSKLLKKKRKKGPNLSYLTWSLRRGSSSQTVGLSERHSGAPEPLRAARRPARRLLQWPWRGPGTTPLHTGGGVAGSDLTFSGRNAETRCGKQRSERENLPVSGREAELHCCLAPVVSFCLPSFSIVLIFATVRWGDKTLFKRVFIFLGEYTRSSLWQPLCCRQHVGLLKWQ